MRDRMLAENYCDAMSPKSTDPADPAAYKLSATVRKTEVGEPEADIEDPLHGGNPPYTTRGIFTAPKFGSAGSGGLENEPGPERD